MTAFKFIIWKNISNFRFRSANRFLRNWLPSLRLRLFSISRLTRNRLASLRYTPRRGCRWTSIIYISFINFINIRINRGNFFLFRSIINIVVNSVIKDANNGNKSNIDKIIRDAYAALDLSSKGNEHLKTTLEQLAEIAEIENDVNNTPKEEEVAPVNPDVNEVNEVQHKHLE